MIDYKDIRHLELEVSSLCNALCPQCGRRASGGVKNPLFTETYMTLQNIKDWFSVDFIKQIHQLGMCGNYGDAMTNPDLIPILQYFKSINPDIRMQMNSNASGRDPEFWRDLGEIFKDLSNNLKEIKLTNLPPNTRILYWAAKSEYPSTGEVDWRVYNDYSNSGVVQSDIIGNTNVKIECPVEYNVPLFFACSFARSITLFIGISIYLI